MTIAFEVHGTCDPRFSAVKEAFAENFTKHGDIGAALAICLEGQMVVDLWGGYADEAGTRPWERDTIVNTYSTTKGMTAICAHKLVERGLLDIDAPVARYWPEFAQAGKERVTVRHLLSHRAGLPALRRFLGVGDAYRWEVVTGALAQTAPWWEPGTKHGYHAVTFGHLAGEVIRRVSGMSVGAFFRKEFAEPLGLDYYIGLPASEDARTAEMAPAPMPAQDPNHPLAKVMSDPNSMSFRAFMLSPDTVTNPYYMNTREWRAAEIPSANGHGNARSLARIYGALANGGSIDGIHVLAPETIATATEEQSSGEDAVLLMPMRFALGFGLEFEERRLSPAGKIFGHAGMGGSFGYADPVARMGLGYTMNKMIMPPDLVDPRWMGMFPAIYGSL